MEMQTRPLGYTGRKQVSKKPAHARPRQRRTVGVPDVGEELHRRRRQRVVLGELELGGEDAALERRALGALDEAFPVQEVVLGDGAGRDALGRVVGERAVLLEEAAVGGRLGHDGTTSWERELQRVRPRCRERKEKRGVDGGDGGRYAIGDVGEVGECDPRCRKWWRWRVGEWGPPDAPRWDSERRSMARVLCWVRKNRL